MAKNVFPRGRGRGTNTTGTLRNPNSNQSWASNARGRGQQTANARGRGRHIVPPPLGKNTAVKGRDKSTNRLKPAKHQNKTNKSYKTDIIVLTETWRNEREIWRNSITGFTDDTKCYTTEGFYTRKGWLEIGELKMNKALKSTDGPMWPATKRLELKDYILKDVTLPMGAIELMTEIRRLSEVIMDAEVTFARLRVRVYESKQVAAATFRRADGVRVEEPRTKVLGDQEGDQIIMKTLKCDRDLATIKRKETWVNLCKLINDIGAPTRQQHVVLDNFLADLSTEAKANILADKAREIKEKEELVNNRLVIEQKCFDWLTKLIKLCDTKQRDEIKVITDESDKKKAQEKEIKRLMDLQRAEELAKDTKQKTMEAEAAEKELRKARDVENMRRETAASVERWEGQLKAMSEALLNAQRDLEAKEAHNVRSAREFEALKKEQMKMLQKLDFMEKELTNEKRTNVEPQKEKTERGRREPSVHAEATTSQATPKGAKGKG